MSNPCRKVETTSITSVCLVPRLLPGYERMKDRGDVAFVARTDDSAKRLLVSLVPEPGGALVLMMGLSIWLIGRRTRCFI